MAEGKTDMKKMTLKDIQDCELDMMIIFDEVCRKYNLRYSLCAGTLIGAVRHQGFIPWDDDIDISMPRPDYEKLIRLNRKRKLWPEHIRFASLEDGTLDAPFIKLFDVSSRRFGSLYTEAFCSLRLYDHVFFEEEEVVLFDFAVFIRRKSCDYI